MTGHDDLTWTWTAPGGEQFSGSPDFIAGAKAGWEARAWTIPAAPRCRFASTCEFTHDPRDTAGPGY